MHAAGRRAQVGPTLEEMNGRLDHRVELTMGSRHMCSVVFVVVSDCCGRSRVLCCGWRCLKSEVVRAGKRAAARSQDAANALDLIWRQNDLHIK